MMSNLLIGLVTMMVCLSLQSVLLVYARKYYQNHTDWLIRPSLGGNLAVMNVVMMLLVLGNLGQIGIWALIFIWLGEFSEFTTAFYHSGVNFTSLGYGDIVMSEQYRLLGPIQSVNGVLMIGVSTAGLTGAFQDAAVKKNSAKS